MLRIRCRDGWVVARVYAQRPRVLTQWMGLPQRRSGHILARDRNHRGHLVWFRCYATFIMAGSQRMNPRATLPNKSLQPTPTAVMPPAAQEITPAVGVAEH
jgi:hypothetical protein